MGRSPHRTRTGGETGDQGDGRNCHVEDRSAGQKMRSQSRARRSLGITPTGIGISAYWFGRSNCLNVNVLMSRNIGVRGGSRAALRKSVSNMYPRDGGE